LTDQPAETYDRTLLLHGLKRDEILTLDEIQRYGIDGFADPDYVHIYNMAPAEWYALGIRLLGRTAVECTRDRLAGLIGRDVAAVAGRLQDETPVTVLDPFAGSCNTLYWILRCVPNATGIACELDPQVYELTASNVARLDRSIKLLKGDYLALLDACRPPMENLLIVFVAPPWGGALDEDTGLDLRETTPPVADIVGLISGKYLTNKIVFAVQVYEKTTPDSLADIKKTLEWSSLCIYDINAHGRNHGILLGTCRWQPPAAHGWITS
jgi:hypothetical protein